MNDDSVIFAIFFIILCVIFGWAANAPKRKEKAQQIALDKRKTNAELERDIFRKYRELGYSTDDACQQARKDIAAAGFEPCIPITAFKGGDVYKPEQYDSLWVGTRRFLAEGKWHQEHPGEPINKEELYKMIYDDFPTTLKQHYRTLDKYDKIRLPAGTLVYHPTHGTCEIRGIVDDIFGGAPQYCLWSLTHEQEYYVSVDDNELEQL